ncbi:MAG: hypothetical protein RBR71_09785 [Gudongella sp.]|nr:hypothetical protein [Gudongella sp.]
MNYKELQERFNELESLNQVRVINQETVEEIQKEFELLKEEFMKNYFEFDNMGDYRDLESIKIKITENILLCRISIDAFLGISDRELEMELDYFYNSNGRVD